MGDWSTPLLHLPSPGTIGTAGLECILADQLTIQGGNGAGAVWPSANRAIYVPVIVESYVTAYQIAFEVTTQSGNYDVGIYDELGTRLVNKGSTAVPAAGIATADITNTDLTPGTYWLAMAIDNGTAAVHRMNPGLVGALTVGGLQDQDSAFALPSTATFSAPASVYWPTMVMATKATI